MSDLEKAARMALEALEYIYTETTEDEDELIHSAITALRQALAEQPAQQPAQQPICGLDVYLDPNDGLKPKLFPKKPAQPSKPLTDEQIDLFINGRGDEGDDDYVEPTGDGFGLTDEDLVRLVRRVEAAHGITGEQK